MTASPSPASPSPASLPPASTTVVCPFCPLHCDDLIVQGDQLAVPDGSTACPRLERSVERLLGPEPLCRIDDQSMSVDEAEVFVRKKLASTENRDLWVHHATLSVARSLAQMESPTRVSIEASSTLTALRNAVRRCGTITATLGDIKAHADVALVLGDLDRDLPRFHEQLGWQESTTQTRVFSVKDPNAKTIAELSAAVRGGAETTAPGLQGFSDAVTEARYVAVVIAPEAFDRSSSASASDAEPAVELLVELVLWLNEASREHQQRVVLSTLDPVATFASVNAWTKNELLDPVSEITPADSVTIRLGTPADDAPPADIQIGGIDPGIERANVYLPAAVQGVHQPDIAIRGEGTVTLPLSKVWESSLPSTTQWLSRLGL